MQTLMNYFTTKMEITTIFLCNVEKKLALNYIGPQYPSSNK